MLYFALMCIDVSFYISMAVPKSNTTRTANEIFNFNYFFYLMIYCTFFALTLQVHSAMHRILGKIQPYIVTKEIDVQRVHLV